MLGLALSVGMGLGPSVGELIDAALRVGTAVVMRLGAELDFSARFLLGSALGNEFFPPLVRSVGAVLTVGTSFATSVGSEVEVPLDTLGIKLGPSLDDPLGAALTVGLALATTVGEELGVSLGLSLG